MNKTNFFGVSGAVKFDKLGNRMSKVVVEQLRSSLLNMFICQIKKFPFSDGLYHRLARFDAEKNSIEWLGNEEHDGSRCWNYKYNSTSKFPIDRSQQSLFCFLYSR